MVSLSHSYVQSSWSQLDDSVMSEALGGHPAKKRQRPAGGEGGARGMPGVSSAACVPSGSLEGRTCLSNPFSLITAGGVGGSCQCQVLALGLVKG